MPKKTMHGITIKTPQERLEETEKDIQAKLDLIWQMIARREECEKINIEGMALRDLLSRWNAQMNAWKLEGNAESEYFARKAEKNALA